MIPIRDLNPSSSFAFVNLLIILLCIAVWIYEITLPPYALDEFIYQYGFVPAEFWQRPWTLFTHMFLHGGWFHIIGNMLYLWVFGDNVEDRFGHLTYFVFYVISGIGAALLQASIAFAVGNPFIPLIGASGAISGVLGAYMYLFPTAKIFGFIPLGIFLVPVEWPAIVFIGLWFLYQIINGLLFLPFTAMGGVAWFAHIGGFLVGILLAKLLPKRGYYS
ncbi:MAG TPA: rhomboid family intramembrane serine protease [Aquifex aeolicus]|uniref:Rhomboid family intramembrane serine protease n=1 Tax=Aquifex aeolicus TaxID=63363 RepID=A0A9D0YPP7_AQUAO|nr:rhomboid family intramembrane serine protease [Aquifex aeolicus]